jgi:solute carrier family 25 citrate transporter 1
MSSPAIVSAKKREPSQLTSLTAGVIAGAIEGAVTYPAEFIKTKAQFSRSGQGAAVRTFFLSLDSIGIRINFVVGFLLIQKGGVLPIIVETVKQHGVRGLYSGAGALIAGNGLKAGVRFMTYDGIKAQLVDHNVNHTSISLVDAVAY